MCKRFCKARKPMINKADWQKIRLKKPSKYHWLGWMLLVSLFAVWMIADINSYITGIEYNGNKENKGAAIEISGVDFVSEEIERKHKSLGAAMKYQCASISEDVIFAFQFTVTERELDDHIFMICDNDYVFGNAKVIRRSDQKIKCTEEYNGELKTVIRPKEVVVKAINVDEWKLMEYTSKDPKESCILQHAIDILEQSW